MFTPTALCAFSAATILKFQNEYRISNTILTWEWIHLCKKWLQFLRGVKKWIQFLWWALKMNTWRMNTFYIIFSSVLAGTSRNTLPPHLPATALSLSQECQGWTGISCMLHFCFFQFRTKFFTQCWAFWEDTQGHTPLGRAFQDQGE